MRTFPYKSAVWTNGSTSVFHPFTPALDAAKVGSIRAAIEMTESTGNLKVEVAYQTSDDGDTWSSAAVISSGLFLSANGLEVDSAFVNMTGTTGAVLFVRFGLKATNVSGSAYELGNVAMRVDIKPH